MNELQLIKEKFGNRDFIEITDTIGKKVFNWLIGENPEQSDVNKVIIKLGERGFIKFLNKGVIVSKHEHVDSKGSYSIYPFEYTDYGTCIVSIYINDPDATFYPNNDVSKRVDMSNKKDALPVALLCKVEVGIDTGWKVLPETYNNDLAQRHVSMEVHMMEHGLSALTQLIPYVKKARPDLKPNTHEFEQELAKQYLDSVIKAQLVKVLGTNVYLSLLEKELLITKIRQERIMTASDKKKDRSKRQLAFRYVVQLPPNYQPRKFDINYAVDEWERSGHVATRWVRKENVATYADRIGYRLTNQTKGDYVAVVVPIAPQTCHRKEPVKEPKKGLKIYR